MAGQAYDVMRAFWSLQDSRDYTKLVDLFADDARIVDPVYGVFEGKVEIARFMELMVKEMGARDISFDLVELHGDQETAWALWVAKTPSGERQGCGLYRVRDGKIAFYRDFMDPAAS